MGMWSSGLHGPLIITEKVSILSLFSDLSEITKTIYAFNEYVALL